MNRFAWDIPHDMKIEDFNERLRSSVLVADGAMGSMLYEFAGAQRCLEELNVTQPEAVFRIHQAYLEAGAQIIETNTFGANRNKLAALGLGDRVDGTESSRRKNRPRGARSRAPRSLSGRLDRPARRHAPRQANFRAEQMQQIFREQAAALEERGVDFFILETFSDLDELFAAVDAIRSFSRLPVVAQLTYSEEGSTFGGTRPAEAWAKLKEQQTFRPSARIARSARNFCCRSCASWPRRRNCRFSAMPNAGFPHRMGDRIVYPKSSPEYFALFAREAAELGVRLLGGCCGTTPEHIRAMAEAAKKLHPATARDRGKRRRQQRRRKSAPHRRARARKQALEENSGRKNLSSP